MVLEQVHLYIREGYARQFELDFTIAEQYISSIDGYEGHHLYHCLEVKDKYLLLVKWRSIEDHEIGFRKSEAYQKWKDLLHHYYDPFPVVEHYEKVAKESIE